MILLLLQPVLAQRPTPIIVIKFDIEEWRKLTRTQICEFVQDASQSPGSAGGDYSIGF